MKTCPRCLADKTLDMFNKHRGRPDGMSIYCKACIKTIDAEHYQKNPKKRIQKAEYLKRMVELAQNFVLEYLQSHPCVDCGYDNIIALDFDHLPGCAKEFNLGDGIRAGYLTSRLQTEIDKCEVVCANCHRIRTATRAGQWRFVATSGCGKIG